MASDLSFARRPKWLVGHVLALATAILFVNLGFWQLGRHRERSELDARLESRMAAEPVDYDVAHAGDIADLEYVRVVVKGTYDVSEEVIVQGRSNLGRSGNEVLTPLVTGPGAAVIVDRGWVPIDVQGPPVVGAEPSPGSVTLEGIIRAAEVRGRFGPVDPPAGVLDRISRVDVARLQKQSAYDLDPFYVQLVAPVPAGGFPVPLELPSPGGGPPHLSYAIQWFAFTGIILIGYPMLLRSTARRAQPYEMER